MESAYAAGYRELYERHWWWRARETMLVEEIRRISPPAGFGDILDIGCGDGLFFERLRELGAPQGVEADASLVRPETRDVHIGPLETFHPTTRFGLIVMADVLEHVEDDTAMLSRALSMLREDGAIVLTVPALPFLWSTHDDINHHYRRYTRRTLRALADRSGARVATMRDWFRWTVPVRLAAKMLGGGDGIARVPSAGLNHALQAISLVDYRLRRVPLWAGSTLFAILRHSAGRPGGESNLGER